jgi:ABC-type sugar transport system substrate-binding protein
VIAGKAMRHRRRTLAAGTAVVAALVVAAGCGSSSSGSSASGSSSSSSSGGSLKGKTVVMVTCAASQNPWCGGINSTFQKDMQAKGAKVVTLQDPQDPSLQAQHMTQAIALHPALISLQADDPNAIIPSLEKAKAAGVPVLNWNATLSPAGNKLIVGSVIANNTQLGVISGQNLVAGLKKAGYTKANILNLTGTASLPITPERVAGFMSVLKNYPQYKVVDTQDTNFDPNTAATQAAQAIAKFKSKGGLQGAWGRADYLALPIATAAKQAGLSVGVKPGGMVIVGGNCTKAGVEGVINGTLAGDATQDPLTEANGIANAAINYLSGKKIPAVQSIQEKSITPTNAKTFLAPCTY